MVTEVNSNNFDSLVLGEKSVPVVVDFWAPWCGPCRSQAPILERFAEKHAGKVKVYKINVDKNGTLTMGMDVLSIPTILVFENGQLKNKAVGIQNEAALEELAGV